MAEGKMVHGLDEEVVREFIFYWVFQLCFGDKTKSLKRYLKDLEQRSF